MIVDIAPRRSPSCSKSSSACWKSPNVSMNTGAIGSSGMMSSRTSPAATRCTIGRCRPGSSCSMNHARTRPSCDHADLAGGGGLDRHVAELPRQLHRTAERLVAGVQVHLLRRRGEGLARRRVHEVLTELHARGELALAVAPLHGQVPHLARELAPRARTPRPSASPPRDAAARRCPGACRRAPRPARPARRAPASGRRGAAACRAPGRARRGAPRAAPASRRTAAPARRRAGPPPARWRRARSGSPRPRTARTPPRRPPTSRDGRSAAGSRPRARRTSAARRSPRGSPGAPPSVSVAAANSRTCSCWKL